MNHMPKSAQNLDALLGAAIRARRHAVGLTQQELGKRCGISFQQLQKYEIGSNRVPFSRLVPVARALGCSIAELTAPFDDEPATPRPIFDYERFRDLPDAARLLQGWAGLPTIARERLLELLDAVASAGQQSTDSSV